MNDCAQIAHHGGPLPRVSTDWNGELDVSSHGDQYAITVVAGVISGGDGSFDFNQLLLVLASVLSSVVVLVAIYRIAKIYIGKKEGSVEDTGKQALNEIGRAAIIVAAIAVGAAVIYALAEFLKTLL